MNKEKIPSIKKKLVNNIFKETNELTKKLYL